MYQAEYSTRKDANGRSLGLHQIYNLPRTVGGLGAAAAPFKCAFQGAFYVCVPQSAAAKNAGISMQRAADALMNKLPFFTTWLDKDGRPATFVVNPIGNSKRGYDGIPGQTTAGIVQTALRGAIELHFQTEGLGQVPPELLSAAKETDQKLSVEKVAFNASAIAGYLNDTTANFAALVQQIAEKAAEGTLKPPLTLEPAPLDRGEGLPFELALPDDFLDQAKKDGAVKKRFPALAVGGGIALAGLLLFGLWRLKEPKSDQHAVKTDKVYMSRGGKITMRKSR